MRWGTFSLAAALLVACAAEQRWVRPGTTEADLTADRFECARLAQVSEPTPVVRSPATPGQVITQSQSATAHAPAERQRRFVQCMEAKGYRLE